MEKPEVEVSFAEDVLHHLLAGGGLVCIPVIVPDGVAAVYPPYQLARLPVLAGHRQPGVGVPLLQYIQHCSRY